VERLGIMGIGMRFVCVALSAKDKGRKKPGRTDQAKALGKRRDRSYGLILPNVAIVVPTTADSAGMSNTGGGVA